MYRFLLPLIMTAAPVAAQAPRVVTDIAPVHSLVSQVMEGVATPTLLVPPGGSPHHFAMRPSEAQALGDADLVVWVGPGLTPWLSDPVERLAAEAHHLTWMESEGVVTLPFREGALFAAHDPDHGEGHDHETHSEGHKEHDDGHAEHAHDDHKGGHADHAGHEDHKDHAGHDDHAAHGSEARDPHVWLDPKNASVFLEQIAAELSELDAANAEQYRANAEAGKAALAALEGTIDAQLSEVRGRPFIVLHDAFHYFEARFEIEAIAAIAASDAETPGAARIRALQDALEGNDLACAFTEPQMDERMLSVVTEGLGAGTGVLDPVGAGLEPGAQLYPQLMQDMADAMETCLTP